MQIISPNFIHRETFTIRKKFTVGTYLLEFIIRMHTEDFKYVKDLHNFPYKTKLACKAKLHFNHISGNNDRI